MRLLGVFALTIATAGAIGCGADGTSPTASGVFPAEGFLGRKLRVEVSGDATNWSDGKTTVSFGDGVVVDKVSVASKTALFADVTISDAAAAGLRDVTVNDGGSSFVLAQAFDLVSPVTVTTQGTLAQGSVVFLSIRNHDLDNPFDTTTNDAGDFTGVTATGPAGTTVSVNGVTEFTVDIGLVIDLDAQAGAVTISSGAGDAALRSPLGNFDIKARTPIVLTNGTAVQKSQSEPFHSEVFEVNPATGPAAVSIAATDPSGNGAPRVALLPASGKFADLISFSAGFSDIMPTTAKMYAVILDNSGTSGYSYDMLATSSPTLSNTIAEVATPHTTGATAQPVTLPTFFKNAAINCTTTAPQTACNKPNPLAADRRVMSFTVAAGNQGKKVHVITAGADKSTDTVVDVFTDAALTQSLGGPSDDAGFGENFVSAPIPANTAVGAKIFIVVTPSDFFSASHKNYDAAFFLE
jgi:hypothetical protein